MRIGSLFKRVGWISVLWALTSIASAHHGGGTFDAKKCFVFKGTVKQVAWANPHAWLYVQVQKSGDASELWGFEFGSISGLSRAGFRPSDFAIGTKVTVTGYANRNPEKHTGSANRLILPDGRDVGGAEIAGTAPASGPGGAPQGSASCPEYK